jgi:uncharacterized protein
MAIIGKPSIFITRLPKLLQWVLLLLLSALIAVAMTLLHLPAGWLLGPIFVGILLALAGVRLAVPGVCSRFSQALIGCLIAQSLTMQILRELMGQWPLFVVVIVCVMLLSWGLGWILARLRVIPPREAIWGSSPGAAGAMIIMARAYDADARLVALMQYARVLLVVLAASIVTLIWIGETGGEAGPALFEGWTRVPDTTAFVQTMLLVAGGVLFGRTRLPAASMLVPMFLGVLLHVTGIITITVPEPFAVFSYLIIGWEVGLEFDREVLTASLRVLPRIFISNLVLIILCGGLGFFISRRFGIDPLSAYLATSPGGANTIAVIAITSPVNAPFIMALQVCRMVSLIILGPVIARTLAKQTMQ